MTSRKSSILKPLRVREPLQDLSQLIPNNDEEETTTTDNQKRRVSFACINKVKEFEATAECTTLQHTPAYDERFSISSDSYQSSLCEQSSIKSTYQNALDISTKSRYSLDKSQIIGNENINIQEVEMLDVSRTLNYKSQYKSRKSNIFVQPSLPNSLNQTKQLSDMEIEDDLFNVSKMTTNSERMRGDSSMDMTNAVGFQEYEPTETCYPLNLTKNQSNFQSPYIEKNSLDSSSMETTEVVAMAETILSHADMEPCTQEMDISIVEEYVLQETAHSAQISKIGEKTMSIDESLIEDMNESVQEDTETSIGKEGCLDYCEKSLDKPMKVLLSRKSSIPVRTTEKSNSLNKSVMLDIEENSSIERKMETCTELDIVPISMETGQPEPISTHNFETKQERENYIEPPVEFSERKSMLYQSDAKLEVNNELKSIFDQAKQQIEIKIPESKSMPDLDLGNDLVTISDTKIEPERSMTSLKNKVEIPSELNPVEILHHSQISNGELGCSMELSKSEEITQGHKSMPDLTEQEQRECDLISELPVEMDIEKTQIVEVSIELEKQNEINEEVTENPTSLFRNETKQVSQPVEQSMDSISNDDASNILNPEQFTNTTSSNVRKIHSSNMTVSKLVPIDIVENSVQISILESAATEKLDIFSSETKPKEIIIEPINVSISEPPLEIVMNESIEVSTPELLPIDMINNSNKVSMSESFPMEMMNEPANIPEPIPVKAIDEAIMISVSESVPTGIAHEPVNISISESVPAEVINESIKVSILESSLVPTEVTNESVKISIQDSLPIEKIDEPVKVPFSECRLIEDTTNKVAETLIPKSSSTEIINTSIKVCTQDSMPMKTVNEPVEIPISEPKQIDGSNESEVVEISQIAVESKPEKIISENSFSKTQIDNTKQNLMKIASNSTPIIESEILTEIPTCEPDVSVIKSDLTLKKSKIEGAEKFSFKNEIALSPINPAVLQFEQKKLKMAERVKTELRKNPQQPWKKKKMNSEVWIFDTLFNSLELIITFNNLENSCFAKFHYRPKDKPEANEILKIAIGPLVRKYKSKLNILCSRLEDITHFLQLTVADVNYAKCLAEDLANIKGEADITISHGKASFCIASYYKHLLFTVEVNMRNLERLTVSDINVDQKIGKVDVNLVHDEFSKAGRDFNFFSAFVINLRKKLE